MDWLIQLDHWLFEKINLAWTNEYFDWFFPRITDLHRETWALVATFAVLSVWCLRERERALKWILIAILSIGFSDLFSYRVVKSLVDRERPPLSGIEFQLRTSHHTGSSFPSNHAANMFAAASTFSAALPALTPVFFAFAFLVAYSRVYVGVHFPLDILGGAIIGMMIAWIMRLLLVRRLGLQRKKQLS